MLVLLSKALFFMSQPTLRGDLVKSRIDILRSADAAGKSDHAGNVNAYRTITSTTEHTVPPHDPLDLHQKITVHLSPLLIQSSQRLDGLIGGHVLRILIVGPIEETAISTEAAMSAMGQIAFHFALFLI